jgi:hypothetical protein
VSGRRDADEALVLTAPAARQPGVLVPMICAHVLARSAHSQVREIDALMGCQGAPGSRADQ